MKRNSVASISIVCLLTCVQINAAITVQGDQFADVPEAEWGQILSVARDGWTTLRLPGSAWAADLSAKNTYIEDGSQRQELVQYSVNQGDDCGLLQVTARTHSQIMAWNVDYAFHLLKNAAHAESQYKIVYVGSDDSLRLRVAEKNANAAHVFFAAADQLVQSESFLIRTMTRSEDRRFVAIGFSANYEQPNVPVELVKGGTFTLDMSLSAAVTEFSIHTVGKSGPDWHHEGVMNYISHNGIPHPRSSSIRSGFNGKEPHIIVQTEYTNVRSADLDEADARLSAFGFPEPGFSKQPSTDYWRLLIVLANVAVGIIGLLLWYRWRRKER